MRCTDFFLALFSLPFLLFASSPWSLSPERMQVSQHSIEIGGQRLDYTATVGSLDVYDSSGNVLGAICFTAYAKQSGEPSVERPITFVFNGGPGSSSVWLHMGAFGPKRILNREEGQTRSPPYRWTVNEETLLDTTDLVFIDPIGTGFSKAAQADDLQFYAAWTDIQSVGDFIRDYLTLFSRWQSPKYLAGESYGTTRAAGLSKYLLGEHGIYLNGIILISVAIDYQTFLFSQGNCLPQVLFLPSFSAAAAYHQKLLTEEPLEMLMDRARAFAFEELLPALSQGNLLPEKKKREIMEKLSSFTGIEKEVLQKHYPHFEEIHFLLELLGKEQQVIGRMDSRHTCPHFNLLPSAIQSEGLADPSMTAIEGIFTGAIHAYMRQELECKQNYAPYQIFSVEANARWYFSLPRSITTLNTFDELRWAMVANPEMKIFVGSGYYDLATPFAAAEYTFSHLDLPEAYTRQVEMHYYEGGHMYYLDRIAHKKFKQDLLSFFKN